MPFRSCEPREFSCWRGGPPPPAGVCLPPPPPEGVATSGTSYATFFPEFDTSLARLDANIAGGGYGSPPSRQCAAQAFLDSARGMRTALYEVVHGAGQTGSPFMPLDSSDGGRGIVQVVSYLQTRDSAAFNVPGFRDSFLLAHDTLSADLVAGAIVDSAYGFGYRGPPHPHSLPLRPGGLQGRAEEPLPTGGPLPRAPPPPPAPPPPRAPPDVSL